jgi:hypothetical protein
MWQVSQIFKNKMSEPVQEIRSRIEILDTDMTPIMVIGGGGPDKSLIDGVVDADVERGTRRTLTLSLLNENGEFSPTSQWGGIFYVNRLIRLYRGLVVGGTPTAPDVEYIPIGTFMIDKTETLVERSMSTIVMAGSDLWKKFTKAQFTEPTSFAIGTPINTVISTLAAQSGVTKLALDPLSNRTSNSNNLQKTMSFEKGETKGDALLTICNNYSIDIFFNPMGVLVTEDFRNPLERPATWQLGYGNDKIDLAYLVRSITEDDRLYNHVYVTGTGDPENIYTAERKNVDPLSPMSVDRIGDRVYRLESGVLASQESVDLAAQTLFYKVNILSQTVSLESICMPAFEGNDVVEVIEPNYTDLATRFLLSSFSVPLTSSKQKLTMKQVITLAA